MSTSTSLYDAVKNNDLFTVVRLLKTGDSIVDVNQQDNNGDTPLHIAIGRKHREVTKYLVENYYCELTIRNGRGDTPLHIAVRRNDYEIVKCLLDRPDCNVNTQNSLGDGPLHVAVQKGNLEIIRSLSEHTECNVNLQNRRGNTPLHVAICRNDYGIVKCLLDRPDCNVNTQNSLGDGPLHVAGDGPLHVAVQKDSLKIIRSLSEHTECNVNLQNRSGNTPLHIAIWLNNVEMVMCLLEHRDCNVNVMNTRDDTQLHLAVKRGSLRIVEYIIKCTGCECNIQNRFGDTPLHTALQEGNLIIIEYLIKEGKCDVKIKNNAGCSPFSSTGGLKTLHKIAESQDVELVHVLVQQNVDVLTNHVDNQLQLVKYILSQDDFNSLLFYIQNGLYINSLTPSGENIVHLLAQFYMDYLYIDFNILFDYELDIHHLNTDDNSPLMVASLLNNSPFIEYFASGDRVRDCVDRKNHRGHTALHLCVIGFTLKKYLSKKATFEVTAEYYPRCLACIDILLRVGANVDMQDDDGKTVLMLACACNDRKLLETLLIHGANVNIVDNHGRSALQYIDIKKCLRNSRCFNLLLSHGCKQFLNQSCLNGNTIIQNVLKFTPLLQIDFTVTFIKFLVYNNVNLQLLIPDDGEIPCNQLSLLKFSSKTREELRQILYLSGGSFVQIIQTINFEVEEVYEASLPETLRENPREKFYLFANNLSLQDICRRVIRQNTGPAIHDRISECLDFPILTDFLRFKDIDSERFSLPVQLESFINDDYEFYNSLLINDHLQNEYIVYYKDCEYLNMVHVGLKRSKRPSSLDNSDSDSDSNSDSTSESD